MNLDYIEPGLQFMGKDITTLYGRIDILARKNGRPVAIKQKLGDYQTSSVIGHLHQYARAVQPENGDVYFVAPHITPQLQQAFQGYLNIHLKTLSLQMESEKPQGPTLYQDTKSTLEGLLKSPLAQRVKRKLLG